MSLRDGIKIGSYTELSALEGAALFFEPRRDRTFHYSIEYGCPGMVDIATGTRFYSEDIQTYITFPLHRVKLVPFTQEEMDAS